jgi:uncharacterized protein YukE
MSNTIDTNPEALRSISSSVRTYTTLQYDIIRTYLQQMSALSSDIQVTKYQQILEAISEWVKKMDELKTEGEAFAAFLDQKANVLEEMMKQG